MERGRKLACLLAKNVAQFPHVSTVIADFEEWDAPVGLFDVVIAATAFHWLDPSSRVRKCGGLLRPGGTLAIVDTHWGAGERDDRFAQESQACYARWDPDHDPNFRPLGPDDLPERNEELEGSGLFEAVAHRRYLCRREYHARAYCDLLGTFSNILAFEPRSRERFLGCIFELVEGCFG
jgi:SAM-dependent methyltransferase